MALLLAQARNVPQAHAALDRGPLGTVPLGGRGAIRQGARRDRPGPGRRPGRPAGGGVRDAAPGLRPLRQRRAARQLGAELLPSNGWWPRRTSDIHLPKTPETTGLLGADLLARAKPGVRVINTGRGGIIDEKALAKAVPNGIVAGAALDVFEHEPVSASPLFEFEQVVVTPHLGASTREAQDKAGVTIAEQVQLALAGSSFRGGQHRRGRGPRAVRAWLPLAERLGRFWAALARAARPRSTSSSRVAWRTTTPGSCPSVSSKACSAWPLTSRSPT